MNLLDRLRRRRSAMRLSCAEVGALLQQYLDGELDAATVPHVSAHLELCRRCGLEASVYRDVMAALSGMGELPDESVERLRAFGERIAHGHLDDPQEHR